MRPMTLQILFGPRQQTMSNPSGDEIYYRLRLHWDDGAARIGRYVHLSKFNIFTVTWSVGHGKR